MIFDDLKTVVEKKNFNNYKNEMIVNEEVKLKKIILKSHFGNYCSEEENFQILNDILKKID
jgi:hypothetical protein